jgi:hypothetical protein
VEFPLGGLPDPPPPLMPAVGQPLHEFQGFIVFMAIETVKDILDAP